MNETKKALLIMPFFTHESMTDQLRSLFMEAFFRRLTAEHNYKAEIIRSDENRQSTLGKNYHSKMTEVDLVIADLYSNNKNVAVEATISCLYGINTYLMAPRAFKGEPFKVAAYFSPYVGHIYDDEDVDNVKKHMEEYLKLGSTREEYATILSANSEAFRKFDEWYVNCIEGELATNVFIKTIRRNFDRISGGVFEFGKPLLDEMERSPFSQLYRTAHLMDFEAHADEVWVFANDITIGIETEIQQTMMNNLMRGTRYRYILPNDDEVKDNVQILRKELEDKLQAEGKRERISGFEVCFVPKELVGQEITMLNPTSAKYSAYLLDTYDDARYLLRLNDKEALRVRTKHSRLWSFEWTLDKRTRSAQRFGETK